MLRGISFLQKGEVKVTRFFKLLIPAVAAVLIMLQASVSAEPVYPEYDRSKGYVNDFAGVISEEAERRIMEMGRELEEKTTAQVTVVTVKSLDGENIKTYANELFEKWGVGQKGKDNGVLILHSTGDREVWIEVGYGLNPILGTIRVTEFFENEMAPYFKSGDFDTGHINGYAAIVRRIAEQEGVTVDSSYRGSVESPARRAPSRSSSGNSGLGLVLIVLFLAADGIFFKFRITTALIKIFFLSSFFRGGRGGRGGWGGGSWGGGGSGGFGGGGGGGFGGFGGGSSGGGGGGGKY